MRRSASGAVLRLLCLASSVAITAPAAIITFTSQSLGGNNYRYTYGLTGAPITTNQEIQIRFNAANYGTLSNGLPPASNTSFSLLLFQPNNPPGSFGDYSLLALIPNPSMAGTFSVDFVWLGPGLPDAQPFNINQLDGTGAFVSLLDSGVTTNAAPEPSTLLIGGGALAALAFIRQARQRRRTTEISR